MRLVPSTYLLLSGVLAIAGAASATGQNVSVENSEVVKAPPVDPNIAKAISGISPDQIQADIEKLVSFKNRSTLSSMDTDLPAGTGINAAADWIFAEFTRISDACGQCLEVKRDDYIEPANHAPNSRVIRDTRLQNIYAVLKGTDPAQADRRVLVTGHYDSRNSDNFNTHDPAPGANDDASGVAVSLESARALTKLRFPSTIVFVAVAGEEQGLYGSRHLAKLARAEGWDLEAVLNNDIVGGDRTFGMTFNVEERQAVRIFSEGVPGPATPEQVRTIQTLGAESDSPSRELARAIAEITPNYFDNGSMRQRPPGALPGLHITAFHPVLIFRPDRFLRGGDHTSFNAEGFPAVRITETRENFDHQHQTPRTEPGTLQDGSRGPVRYGDLIEFVDFHYVAEVAQMNAVALATFATAPGEPRDVRILTKALDNNTELTWKAPAGAPAKTTYEVVWRTTDAPTWTYVLSVGSTLSAKLALSKDNVVFGVRASDGKGHNSPAVYPMPERR